MNNASVKLILRESKKKKDGTAPVWIRITANRKSRFISTGVYIEPKYWNDRKSQVRASHPFAPTLNTNLEKAVLLVGEQAFDTPSASALKKSVKGGGGSFTGYFERFIEGLDTADRYWDWKKYRVTLKRLRACMGNEINWKDLDRPALISFERHLREKCENSVNTTRKELQRLRRVIRQGIKDGIVKHETDPFLVYDSPAGKQPERRKLSIEEIATIERLELEADSPVRVTRDAFLLAFYGGGIRFGDVCRLRREHIKKGRLEYRMMKTGSLVSVPLPEPALQIVEVYSDNEQTYLFPFLKDGDEKSPVGLRRRINSRNVIANQNLKRLARLAGLKEEGLTFHVARHSFADYARRQSGDLYAVSKTLGHTNLQVTQQNLRSFDRDSVDKLAKTLWKH